ncbi:DEAD/DEAH box helicase [Rhizobium leguminosarum bv. viciae]|uniref:DEAD/DEAH box helicase n=1 Tax=Rhizobium leguminosarum TaxID=384 RepID=UPI00103FF381|nr:DEAD/DEAH box helicase [Rhizobium leguminosarum]MBY5376103.1 DEAD/DEAH box helicase [Rhizobium leguminosarum]TBY55698.1 DEAD/DEAH box helicase [Rhizobium leguminosarum bv. viciae]
METIEELTTFLTQVAADGARGRLQARGEARSIVRQDGVLPDDAPAFGNTIDTDLAEYALSLLRASMALRESQGEPEVWRRGFARAGNAFEALVQNGAPDDVNRGFYRIAGAASYHLASYSALAFSLISQRSDRPNFAPPEEALAFLILRDLDGLGAQARNWLLDPAHGDDSITRSAAEGELDPDDVVRLVVTTTIFRSLAFFEFALQTGVAALVDEARSLLRRAISLAKHANAVSLWWTARIALNLIDDLWASSLHQILPVEGPAGAEGYGALRRLFLGELYSRRVAEVELWPSQLEAARRAIDLTDDLVVALPTSAGKTRIAEIAALMALASGQRVLIVTPLRALSAQTERSFRKTFASLGFTVSSLYGASGVAIGDEDALRSQDIVIATPEKLDFALRNDPTIIADVGLVVLDEGHLIGPSEREIRYESLVQRLLRRPDNAARRIVCLSAILPEGDQLNDLTAWIRSDVPGPPIQLGWRPTRQRFGTLTWQGNSGRLGFDLEVGGPYITHFIPEEPAIRPRRTPFPRNNKELTLAAAWRFSAQGKRALIFCTQRDHVEGYAETVVDLHRRGYVASLLDDVAQVERALAVGREWLGPNHPAVQCLPIGVAIHHGRLPGPFLREVEALLAAGILRVTVASPTLAQGLNLNAAVLLIPTLYRAGVPLSGEEFANVAGRAGRAFVDLEGLVLHVMYQPENWRARAWRELVGSSKARSLTSGIISIISEVIARLARTNVFLRADAIEYLANAQEAWFPQDQAEDTDSIESLIERLDATVFGLIEALDTDSAELPRLLDEALTGSLWARQIGRLGTQARSNQLWVLWARASLIWNKSTVNQRRATFAMGVGLEAGLAIDAIAVDLTALLDEADAAALAGNLPVLSASLVGMAERLFVIRPFVPDVELPGNWRDLLGAWLAGTDVVALGLENMRVVEDAFVYRLVRAIEAVRMRRRAEGGETDTIEGSAAATIEAGVPQTMMAILVRAGLPSRIAATTAIRETQPTFVTRGEMNQWLGSNQIAALSDQPDWPTANTGTIWKQFRNEALSGPVVKWAAQEWNMQGAVPAFLSSAIPGRISINPADGVVSVTTPDFKHVIGIQHRLRQFSPRLLHVEYAADHQSARVMRIGRGEARWELP